jgi:hypothetical protein
MCGCAAVIEGGYQEFSAKFSGLSQLMADSVGASSTARSRFGFRPGRSAHDAVYTVRGYIRKGYSWAVDMGGTFTTRLRPGNLFGSPGADPHAGWCGEGGRKTRSYPIGDFSVFYKSRSLAPWITLSICTELLSILYITRKFWWVRCL